MKYHLLCSVMLGTTILSAPAYAQFSSFPTGIDNCSTICFKVDFGSANNDNSFFNNGLSNSSNGTSNLRWQVGVTWRPNAPEVAQAEGERTKQRLEDNRNLMLTLAEAIAQNKTELARGIAILLAPRLGYSDPRILIAEMKEGSIKVGTTKIEPQPATTNPNSIPSIAIPPSATNGGANPIELR
jgi:hypothetical protein